MMIATKEQRNARAKKTAEVFTPHVLVNQMLDKLPKSTWQEGKTFCDPACGSGNMLINVLYRKIAVHEHDPLEALQSVYGVDIMRDNVRETRLRLLRTVINLYILTKAEKESAIATVLQNVVWLNRKKYPQGSLQYDFAFKTKAKQNDIDRWVQWLKEGVLDEVTLPVGEEPGTGIHMDMFAEKAGDDEGYE